MKKILQLLLVLLFAGQLQAQDRTVSGTVREKDGGPLPGATVVAKGSLAGTTTDINGAYSFRAPAATTMVVVSYTGFGSKEATIPADGVVNVELSTESSMLGEVVISVRFARIATDDHGLATADRRDRGERPQIDWTGQF